MSISEDESELIEELVSRADEKQALGDATGARDILLEAARVGGAPGGVFHNLGIVEHQVGMLESALENYENAIDRGYPSLVNRGLVYEKLGRPMDALSDYRAALKYKPSDVDALTNMGLLYLELGDLEAAYTALRQASTLDIRVNWQLADVLIARGDKSGAVNALDAAIAAGESRAHVERGILANQLGDLPGAIRHFNDAIDAGARGARAELAIALDLNDQPERGLEIARLGIELGDELCFAPAAVIAESLGKRDLAIEYYRAAIAAGDATYQDDLDHLLGT